MHLIISKKLNVVNANAPQGVIDLAAVRNAVGSSASMTHVASTPEERDAVVERQTKQGYTCHVFDYQNSFQSVTTVASVRAVA